MVQAGTGASGRLRFFTFFVVMPMLGARNAARETSCLEMHPGCGEEKKKEPDLSVSLAMRLRSNND